MAAIVSVPPGSTDAGRAAVRTVDQASTEVQDAIENAADAAHPTVDRVALAAHRTVDKIAGAAGQAAQSVAMKGEQLTSAQARAMDRCRGYVRANPLASIGAAAVAGYLLSRLFRAR